MSLLKQRQRHLKPERTAMISTTSRLGRRVRRPAEQTGAAVALCDVRKVHGRGDGAVVALDGISVRLERGSFTAIMGPSGSGKSTFLHVAAGLDRPTSGSVALGDVDLSKLSERRLTILRRQRVGFVFQAFNLMPTLTVAQNIGLPLRLDGRRPRRADVRTAAERVGLGERLRHYPSQLSAGQRDCAGADHAARGALRRRADRRARHTQRASGARAPA